MSEVKNVPRLRFPEFNEQWDLRRLDQIGKFIGGGTPARTNFTYWDGEIPWISSSDIVENNIRVINLNQTITKDGLNNSATKKIPKNSVIIVSRVGLGKFAINEVDLCTSQDFTNLIPNRDNSYFLGYQFEKLKNKFISLGQGTSIKGFTTTDLKNFRVNIPSLPEQQKIADSLTAVDKRIELLEKKKTLLETYKKGVMKKIFNQEIRFKDDNGSDFPNWEKKRLGDIGEFKTSSVDKKLDDDEQEIFLVNYMNVYRHEKITNENKYDLMVVTAKPNQIDSNNLIKGDILFTPSSETPDDIGHSVVIFEDLDNTLYSYHLLRFRPMIKIDILYSHYFCNNDLVLNQICRFATGSTRFTISKDSFSKILISLPCFEEQSKIAKFLDSIDKQLELLETQIDKSKTWKKGLLQKMFV